MSLTLWSKSNLEDQVTHFFRPTAAGNINPVFGYGATVSYSATGDNNIYLSLSGQDFFGNIDDTPTLIGPYVANPSKVGGSAAGVLLFNNATANTPTVTGGAFWFNETSAGSNTYNVNYQNFNYSAPLIPADGPAVSLAGSVVSLETNISNVTSFNWDWTSSTFIFGYETTDPVSTSRDIYLQGFTSSGTARGALAHVATLAAGAIWDVKEASTTTDTYYHEDNTGQSAAFVAQTFTPATGNLTGAFSISTGLADLTAYNLANNVYAFAGKDTAGNSKIEFDLVNSSGAVTASHSVTLSGAIAATRIVGMALPNNSGEVFAYSDPNDNHLHLIQVDASSNIVQDLTVDITTSGADRIRSFGDGRVELEYRTAGSGSVNEVHFNIYDTRTTGISTVGTSGNESIAGTPFNDTISGGAGNDRIGASLGANTLDGGPGVDTIILGFNLSDASLSYDSAGHVVLDGPSAHNTLSNFEHYQFADGTVTRFTQSNLVDDLYYDVSNKDVYAAGSDPTAHYNTYGWHEGRNPNADFSTTGYLAANADVRAAGLNPLTHYDQYGWKEGRDPSAAFDNELYLANNPDVKAAGLDPLAHYLQYGQAEGRQTYAAIGKAADLGTHPGFDAEYYLLSNADVAKAAIATGGDSFAYAYQHYENYGAKEGRAADAYFDTAYYLAHNPDVAAAHLDPLAHYDQYGWKEGRDPSAAFHTNAYLAANPDVAAAHIDPLLHYLQYGAVEGRPLA